MGLFSVFKKGLQKTATAITRGVVSIFTDVQKWDDSTFTALEHALVEADFGVEAAKKIKDDLKDRYDRGLLSGEDNILEIARDDIAALMQNCRTTVNTASEGPTVILMVGVNGSGKTTTAGKLAWIFTRAGKKVMLGACDTFRAAASEQLKLWAERTGAGIVASKTGADPLYLRHRFAFRHHFPAGQYHHHRPQQPDCRLRRHRNGCLRHRCEG